MTTMDQKSAEAIVGKLNKFGNALTIVKSAVDNLQAEYPELVQSLSPLFGAATAAPTLEEAKKIVEAAAKAEADAGAKKAEEAKPSATPAVA